MLVLHLETTNSYTYHDIIGSPCSALSVSSVMSQFGVTKRSTQTQITKEGNKMGTKNLFLNEKIQTTKNPQPRSVNTEKSYNIKA